MRSLRSLKLFTLLIVFSAFAPNIRAANVCVPPQSLINASSQIPLCEKSNSILSGVDNTFPTGAVFIALEAGSIQYQFIREAYRFIVENPELSGKLNLIVSDRNHDQLKAYEDSKKIADILNDVKRVNIIPIDYPFGEIRWTQDWLQFVYSRGEPALYRLTYRGDTQVLKDQRLTGRDANPSAQIAKSCQIPVINHSAFINGDDQGGLEETMGGNFDVVAGSLWGVGFTSRIENIETNQHAYAYGKPTSWSEWYVKAAKTYRSQIQTIESNGDRVLKIQSSIAPVAHYDELFNTVKTNGNACGFAILSASSELGIKILEATSSKNSFGKETCLDNGGFQEDDPRLQERIKSNSKNGCVGFSGKRISDVLADVKFREFSREYQKIMTTNEAALSKKLAEEGICPQVQFVRLPVLVEGKMGSEPYSYIFGDEYLIPNVVNGLVLSPIHNSSTYIVEKTGFKPIDDFVKKTLSAASLQINVKPIFAPQYFTMGGGLHCASNTVQICRSK